MTSTTGIPEHFRRLKIGGNFVDLAGAHLLEQEARRRRAMGGALYLFNLKSEPMEMLKRSGAFDEIGADNFFKLGDDVFHTLYQRLDAGICSGCTVRIFHPCKRINGPAPKAVALAKSGPH